MRRIWLALSAAGLILGASALAQENTSADTSGFKAPQETNTKANRQSDPRAIAFLTNKVDQTMYNLVSRGVKDAVVRMRLENSPQFGDLTVVHYWQQSPPRQYTDVEGLADGMNSFKQIVASQLGDHIRRALLLPASDEFADDIVTMESDGEFVKIIAESRQARDNSKRISWYTSDGRLVRGTTEGSNPMTGPFEARRSFELERVGNQYLIKSVTTRLASRPTQIRLHYGDEGEYKVLSHATVTSARGTMSTKFDITFNGGIDQKVFAADESK